MATLSVGPGKQFTTIAAAVAAAQPGDTVAVQAGTYVNDYYATIKSAISLVAVGGQVTMLSTSTAATAAALITIAAPATAATTITGFTLSGMRTTAGNGAGILVQSGAVTIQGNNQDGLLTTANAATTIAIKASEFAGNGNDDGFSGNIAVSSIKSLTITGSYIHDAVGGDEVRSLAATTTITGSRIEDNAGNALYAVEAQNGGVVTLSGDTIEKGAASTVAAAIAFGGGTVQPGSTLSLSGDTLVSDKAGATVLRDQATAIASVASSTLYGFTAVASGPVTTFANTVASARPATSTAALIAGGPVAAVNYGRAGAVVASGRILTVGTGQQYATLGAALAASKDGDTIQVAAGTYVNDTATITTKVIIEGVGGQARFVDTAAPANGLAQFVTTTDVTFQNLEIFGAATLGGTAAAILDLGGNLTVDNCDIHNNQAGIVATVPAGTVQAASGSVGIFDTEIAANGTATSQGSSQAGGQATGTGANVAIGAIGSLTLQNDLVMDAVAGPEITSDADNTTLVADRIVQAAGNTAPVVDLPDGGLVAISGTAIQDGASTAPAPDVQVGGGTVIAGSAVTLTGDTLIAASTAAPTTFVANAAPASAPAASVAVTGTTFVGGAAGSVQVSGGMSSAATTATGLAVDTAAPDAGTAAPAAAPLTVATAVAGTPQPGQLILDISETAYHGDAQFTLAVDGSPVAGTLTAIASHAAGQTEQFIIAGPYAPGPHIVTVAFVNSLGAGSAARALYVDGMTFNGVNADQQATLSANGAALLATGPVTTPTEVSISLSEIAAAGDALAFITIDGKVQGGVQTITAAHATGQTETLGFLVDLAPGAHTIAATFLNGATTGAGAARALFVDAVEVGAAHVTAASGAVASGSPSTFAFTVAPPAAANGSLFVTSGLPGPLSTVLPHT